MSVKQDGSLRSTWEGNHGPLYIGPCRSNIQPRNTKPVWISHFYQS